MRRFSCAVIAIIFVALCLPGKVPAQSASLLPDSFGTWQASSSSKSLKPQELGSNWAQWTNGDNVLRETGLSAIEQRSYRSGNDELTLRAFRLQDPSSAYEFYTFLLAPGMRNMGVGENSALSQYDGRILVGNLVVQANLSPNVKPETLQEIVPALKAKADSAPFPPLKSYMPKDWRVFGSEKYALGPEAFRSAITSLDQGALSGLANEVGFKNGVEAMLARYRSDHDSGVLMLLEYPTPQLAEQHLHHLEQALPDAAKKAGAAIERKASVLSIVFAPSSRQYSQALRDQVTYETQVTWNEPRQTATDPPWVIILSKIFLFTGLFLGVATGLGVAFGGVRVLTKRLFPGKVFDRPESVEVLQMGLSGKKIDPSDMY
jgi:hypothetical protein